MARGGQDFGYPDYTFGASGVDNNEIQQMLLGFGLVDGLGRTMFYDDFNQGLSKWQSFQSAAGMDRELWTFQKGADGIAFRSPYACEIKATAAAGNWGQILTGIICGTQQNVGLEIGCIVFNGVPIYDFFLDYRRVTAGNPLKMGLQLDASANQIRIYRPAGTTVLDTFNFDAADGAQRLQVKITADFVANKYKRLIVAEKEYDISNIAMQTGSTITAGDAVLRLFVYSIGGAKSGYYGYVRLTKDEP